MTNWRRHRDNRLSSASRNWWSYAAAKSAARSMKDRISLRRRRTARYKLLERWSEWQDLNLRPPRPERVPPQENSTFSVKYGYVRGRLFTFGCGLSVGKLSGDGSARSQHSPDNPDGDGRTRGRTSRASCRRNRRSRAWAPRAAPAM